MTREEIIELARQAGFERLGHTAEDWVCHLEDIEEFIKLVAEKEREAFTAHAITSAEKAIDVAIKLEREACAKICEEPYQGSPKGIAEQIRARGQE
jgi:hypothetical protein